MIYGVDKQGMGVCSSSARPRVVLQAGEMKRVSFFSINAIKMGILKKKKSDTVYHVLFLF